MQNTQSMSDNIAKKQMQGYQWNPKSVYMAKMARKDFRSVSFL